MSDKEMKLTDALAIDRTRLAAERSLMAWLRTSLSMITFGFTIYKFMQFMGDQSRVTSLRPNAPRNLALALIGIGTFALITAILQHRKYVRTLGDMRPSGDLGPGLHRGLPPRAPRPPDVRERPVRRRAPRVMQAMERVEAGSVATSVWPRR